MSDISLIEFLIFILNIYFSFSLSSLLNISITYILYILYLCHDSWISSLFSILLLFPFSFEGFYWYVFKLKDLFLTYVQSLNKPKTFFTSFFFNFIFKLYIIVLVLPNIKMNPPQVYMCSPSWTLLPPPSPPPYHPSGSSQCTSPNVLGVLWKEWC